MNMHVCKNVCNRFKCVYIYIYYQPKFSPMQSFNETFLSQPSCLVSTSPVFVDSDQNS